jgi:hypothetical protein
MGLDASARRRWSGVLALGAALLMLVAGQTVLRGKLTGGGYLLYWLLCLVLTSLAILIAFADVRATSHEIRRQERALLEDTIKEIETEAKNRQSKTKP